jgi:soluble lytic murein transglycosylase
MNGELNGRRASRMRPSRSAVRALWIGVLLFATACQAVDRGANESGLAFAGPPSAGQARRAIERGLRDYEAGRDASARRSFALAARGPRGVIRGRALYMLGLTEIRLERFAGARDTLLRAAKEHDVLGDYALYHAGRAASRAGDAAGAVTILSDLRLRYLDSRWRADAARLVGVAFLALDKPADARSAFSRALEEGLPEDLVPEARLALGESYARAKNSAAAAAAYKALWLELPETPEADEAGARLARMRAGAGKPGALATLEERMGRAERLFRKYAYEKALGEYRNLAASARAAGDRERAYEASLQGAQCLFRLRRYPEATTAFREVRTSFAGRRGIEETAYWEARSLVRERRFDEGILGYRRLIADHGRSHWGQEARFRLAMILEDRQRLDEARREYGRFLKGDPGEHRDEALWRLGWIDHKRAREGDARSNFERLAASTSDEALARQAAYWVARIDEGAGRRGPAAARYRAIARNAPLSYYRFAAEARLQALGESPEGDLGRLPAKPPPVRTPLGRGLGPHFERGLELVALRQTEDAGKEIALVRARGEDLRIYFARLFLQIGEYYQASRVILSTQADSLARSVGGRTELLRYTYPQAWPEHVRAEAARNQIDPRLVWAVMREESTFRPAITSPAGAVGLLQIMPATARRIGPDRGLPDAETKLRNPRANISLGAHYLGKLLARYEGQPIRAIAGYNAGEEAVDRWLGEMPRAALADPDAFIEEIPYTETRDYVKKVLKSYHVYARLYPSEGGAAQIRRSTPSQYLARSSRLSGLPLGL